MKVESNLQGITNGCPICTWSYDDPDYLFLHETEYWRVVLAPNQTLVGRCVVFLKRHCGDLTQLSSDEILDWLSVVEIFEKTLKNAFDTTMFNWSCYMNHAYSENQPNPHVHWWAVPRYDHQVIIDNQVFEDKEFGNPYDHEMYKIVPRELHTKIAGIIKASITQTTSNR